MDWGEDPYDATPLTEDQRSGLKLAWVTTRAELNEAETDNVLAGMEKWWRRSPPLGALLDDKFVRALHRDMFSDVWRWAGRYRTEHTNIGCEFWKVSVAVVDLVADATHWFAADAVMSSDAAAAQFHHRLVHIHPFPNGNGRHAREMTDLILRALGKEPFTWGGRRLGPVSAIRQSYVEALQAADQNNYAKLRAFVRS